MPTGCSLRASSGLSTVNLPFGGNHVVQIDTLTIIMWAET